MTKVNLGKTRIAIMGATSHIAKGLIYNFLQNGEINLHLYIRQIEKVSPARSFLKSIKKDAPKYCVIHKGYNDFLKCSYDVVINCIGVGTMSKLQGDYTKYFTVTEKYDNLVINYLKNHPNVLYIGFSSGAVYGREFLEPASENTVNPIRVNHIVPEDYYTITRLNAEAKHRAFKNLNIVDFRLFSYFSRFADLEDDYFIVEVINCILNKKVFKTNKINITRDYVHPKDLFSVIKKCIKIGKINGAFDIVSRKPASKWEILDYFSSEYGLKYKIVSNLSYSSATGSKNKYYSISKNAIRLGFKPKFTSMEAIKEEAKYILNL